MKKQASKFAALLICGTMVLSLAACGDGGKKTEPTPDASVKQSYTAGTYTGTATGMKGDITVEVTVSEDAITDVIVKEHQETYGIGYGLETSPVEVLPKQIVETQSLGVDNVTGATITTAAIKNAVASAVSSWHRSFPGRRKGHHSGKAGCNWRRNNAQRRQTLSSRYGMAEETGL